MMNRVERADRKFRAWLLSLAACIGLLTACSEANAPEPAASPAVVDDSVDAIATAYVRLVLAVGEHDSNFVDAYYGPAAWREEVAAEAVSIEDLATRAEALSVRLEALRGQPVDAASDAGEGAAGDDIGALRLSYLRGQLRATATRLRMLGGEQLPFDEESAKLYDAVAPHHDDAHYLALIEELDAELAEAGYAEGTVSERYAAFQEQFVIPTERLDTVFRTAIDACRERTAERVELPSEESFTIEYVTDQPWSAYNWYQGGYQSLIQVNTDLPIAIDRAVDLACHEGYPGHHVYNLLLEKHLVRERGWPEGQVYALFSPQSLIAEGSANYGIEMAFPGEERLSFERDVLFPLAGLDPARAVAYDRVRSLAAKLGYASNDAARAYLDGERNAEETADWLVTHAASPTARAEQRVRFIDRYRSYVINYNLGKDLVAAYVDREAGDDPDARWRVFLALLSSPRLPSGLQ